MTTLVSEEELVTLQAIASELGFSLQEQAAPPPPAGFTEAARLIASDTEGSSDRSGQAGGTPLSPKEVDKLRKGLEDLYNLM